MRLSISILLCVAAAMVGPWIVTSPAYSADQPRTIGTAGAVHLLSRSGIGALPTDILRLSALTRRAAVEKIIAGLSKTPQNPMPAWVNQSAPIYWARGDMHQTERQAFDAERSREIIELRRWWVREIIETQSPQTEKLVLLWHSLFATAYSALDYQSTSVARQNQLLRQLGSGNYRDLLKAMLRDPALLQYLDNLSNGKNAPNENLGREFLELYTLGEGSFTEHDVRTSARMLTGRAVSEIDNMQYELNQWQHDGEPKKLLGYTGIDGDDLVDIVLQQEQSSVHIARRFWRSYISETHVDRETVRALARDFRESGYQIKALLRSTLLQAAFWDQQQQGSIIKSPVDLLLGVLRSTASVPLGWEVIPAQLSLLGQTLFDPPDVAGWPGYTNWVNGGLLVKRNAILQQVFDDSAANAVQASAAGKQQGMMMQGMLDNPVISVRLAAENYQGAANYDIALLLEEREVWSSGKLTAASGRETELYGTAEDASQLPWQTVQLTVELPEEYDAVRVRFLNDAAGVTGDRNLYIDRVQIGDEVFSSTKGTQRSRCPPRSSIRAGSLYCAGSLIIPREKPAMAVSVPEDKRLRSSQPYLWWVQHPRNGNWQEMVLGLPDLEVADRHWPAFAVALVNSAEHGFGLHIKSTRCSGECFLQWPDCAWRSDTRPQQRSLFFALENELAIGENCHWETLEEPDQQLVGALVKALPEIFDRIKSGARAGNHAKRFEAWQTLLETYTPAIESSIYSRAASTVQWSVLPAPLHKNRPPDSGIPMVGSVKQDLLQQALVKLANGQGAAGIARLLLPAELVSEELAAANDPVLDAILHPAFNLK